MTDSGALTFEDGRGQLIPLGKCHWMIPILQDKETFKSRRATWSEIADGGAKCQVTLLNPANDMFTRMPVNDHVVSDHCPGPYERCLEALLLQAGGAVPDPEGWVAFFQVSSTGGGACTSAAFRSRCSSRVFAFACLCALRFLRAHSSPSYLLASHAQARPRAFTNKV
jgi:hypothetical protein